MENLISFINAFLSYFILFGVSVILILICAFVGIKLRKLKKAQEEALKEEETATTQS